ncbi:MAG: S1C family serine protease [Burkholderiaceae bacterium]
MLLGSFSALAQGAHTAETIFEQASPSIWGVEAFDAQHRQINAGSAVVVGPGLLVTNCHVLARSRSITVRRENLSYDATLEAPDPERDLCQLRVANFSAPAVEIADISSLKIGARVYAIGNPRKFEATISDGLLSGLRRSDMGALEVIQTTAPISAGSSGGGLFDARGRLIGITTSMVRDAQNLNFALPASWIPEIAGRNAAWQASQAATRTADAAVHPLAGRVYRYTLQERPAGTAPTWANP